MVKPRLMGWSLVKQKSMSLDLARLMGWRLLTLMDWHL
jgi:hypothetical protein